MTSEGPFQHKPIYDSVILWSYDPIILQSVAWTLSSSFDGRKGKDSAFTPTISVTLWGGRGHRKGTLIVHLHGCSVSLRFQALQYEKGASELWQSWQTRTAQTSSSLCRGSWYSSASGMGETEGKLASLSLLNWSGHLGRGWNLTKHTQQNPSK